MQYPAAPRVILASFRQLCTLAAFMLATLFWPTGDHALAQNSAGSKAGPAKVRFLVGVPAKVRFKVYTLVNPPRVVVDLPEVDINLPSKSQIRASGIIENVTYNLLKKGRARLVLTTKGSVRVAAAVIKPASSGRRSHLALDLVPLKPRKRRSISRPRFSLGGPSNDPFDKPAATSRLPLIVIDAGHGGNDSGAKRHGIQEKDIVLTFAKALRDRLLATKGYRILLTRDRDVLIKLSRRVEIARENKADLFVSVHADYVSGRYSYVRGATIYTLKPSMARRLAKRGSRSLKSTDIAANTTGVSSAVRNILADLEKRRINSTDKRSTLLANSMLALMGDATKLKPDPHRNANFKVLKSAHVPSVLIELAYVSNKQDAKLLNSPEWRSRVTKTLVLAIENYFSHSDVRLPL